MVRLSHYITIWLLCVFAIGSVEANPHFLTLRRSQGKAIGINDGYTTLGSTSFFSSGENRYLFSDFRIYPFDNGSDYAANAGAGVRFTPASSSQVFGVNAYYDYRRDHGVSLSQFSLGFEVLGDRWNFSLNTFLPIGPQTRRYSYCLCDDYIGDYVFIQEGFVDSLKGAQLDIFVRLGDFSWGDIRLGISPYYFKQKHGCKKNASGSAAGSALRLNTIFANYFTFNVSTSYDPVFKSRTQVQLGIAIPFDFADNSTVRYSPAYLRENVYRPVQRREMLIVNTRQRYGWNWP